MRVGILALQGAVEPHAEKLRRLGAEPVAVLKASDLVDIQGVILPGGESTTMLRLLRLNDLFDPLKDFVNRRPAWGLCAGAILLAKRVTSPEQPSLGAMQIAVERNAFGRQIHSFIARLNSPRPELDGLEGVFIRAPRIRDVQGGEILMSWQGEPVMVEEGDRLAATFHPELTESDRLHEYFLKRCEAAHG